MDNVYKPRKEDVFCIEIFGRRLAGGQIQLGYNTEDLTIIKDWPDFLEIGDVRYKLGNVKKNIDENGKLINNIEWGVYV